MQFIDTHCHLVSDKLKDNVSEILKRAQENHVQKVINIAYSPQTALLALEHCRQFNYLVCTLGIQPHDANEFTEIEGEKIKQLAKENTQYVVGIGEIGLDAYYTLSPMEKQIECFEYFLDVALELNLPVVVHVRETHQDVFSRLSAFSKKGLTGVIHCFTGTKEEARAFLDCGFYISFSGIVTFKNAVQVQEAAKIVPNDKILIETDSPYLSPVPLRGKVNEPAHIKHTNEFLAYLRGQKEDELAKLTTENAKRLFRLKM